MKPGRAGTMTHDYKRNGTTTLFAALNVLDGTVVGRCMQRHRHQELLRFLNAIERAIPAGKVIHVILDNYAAHKHPNVRRWLAGHPRWVFHFHPDLMLVAERNRGLLRQTHPAPAQTRHLPFAGRSPGSDQPLHRAPQPGAPPVHLEGRSQGDHRRRQAWASNVGDNPLGRPGRSASKKETIDEPTQPGALRGEAALLNPNGR
jgi:DDE superfamily endonuclease